MLATLLATQVESIQALLSHQTVSGRNLWVESTLEHNGLIDGQHMIRGAFGHLRVLTFFWLESSSILTEVDNRLEHSKYDKCITYNSAITVSDVKPRFICGHGHGYIDIAARNNHSILAGAFNRGSWDVTVW